MGAFIGGLRCAWSAHAAPIARATSAPAVSSNDKGDAQVIGNAVVCLIFSIANREVTFFSGTAPMSRL